MDIGVLTVTTVALAALAVLASVRMLGSRRLEHGRVGRAWSAGTLVVLALVAWYFEAGHHQRQELATEAMTALLDNPAARADCQRLTSELFDLSPYDGYVYWDNSDVAKYKRHVCHNLASYASGGQARPTDDEVSAVHLIAHESMHVAGLRVEAETECHAVQMSHQVAEFLGATPAQARALQERYFADFYPRLRNDYRSGECREGGEYDIHPERAEFP